MNDISRLETLVYGLAAHLGISINVCYLCSGKGTGGPYYNIVDCENCEGKGVIIMELSAE